MRNLRWFAAPGFLVFQALLIHLSSGVEHLPAMPELARFPVEVGAWKCLREDPLAAGVTAQLKADRILSRTYFNRSTGSGAGLFVAWFQSQRAGDRQPHSPKVCLPGSGWIPTETGEVTIGTDAGPLTLNRYVVENRGARSAVLYWYQTPRRVIAGEWAAKLWLVADAIRDKRTDTALVRIVVPVAPGRQDAALASATAFVRACYPLLRETLPHR
jgi:EpsI family protein